MFARGLIGLLGEFPDEVLKDVAHLVIGNRFRAQVDFTEAADQQWEEARTFQPDDLVGEMKTFEDIAYFGRKALQIARQTVRAFREIVKSKTRRVRNSIQAAQHRQRQNDFAVFRLFVIAAQQVGKAPDEIDLFLKAVHLLRHLT